MNNYKVPQNAIITIAGTVGVGKSTLTQALADKLNFKTSFENVDHNPYLDKFYDDFERWSFHLQIYFLAERFKEQKRMFEYGGGFIQDRSIYEDVDIFDMNDVVWTFNTRFQGDKDIIVLPGMRNHPLDPSELPEYNPGSIRFRGMSAKTIFDGTVPFDMKEHFVRAKFQEVEDWEKYLK